MGTPQPSERPSRRGETSSRPSQEMGNFDESYWQAELPKRPYFKQEVGFEKYRAALRYGADARRQHGQAASFEQIEKDLAAGWSADSGLSWDQARGAVEDAWKGGEAGDAIANKGGFDQPPTFQDTGSLTPRSRDEPNR